MRKNLVGNKKVSNFALAFGKQSKRTLKQRYSERKKKFTKNLVSSNFRRNFVVAFGFDPKQAEH